jgi:hypothetical protein
MRIKGWEQTLARTTRAAMRTPYAWGGHDCALFAAGCVASITGEDFASEFRGSYDDEDSARRLLASLGCADVGDLASRYLPVPRHCRRPRGRGPGGAWPDAHACRAGVPRVEGWLMPEAIATAIVSWAGLTGTAAAVTSAAIQVAIIAGAHAAISQNSEEKQQGGLIDLQLNSAAPRQLVIGKRMVGGNLIDWYLGSSNNTKLYMPVYLSEGPCGQITRVFADGRVVWNTALVHGVRTTIPDFRSGGDRLWLTYYDGREGQTADATLVGLGQGWTSDNKMTGCAWVLVECQWDSDNMRSPPSLSFEMEGAKLYDRRKDTTAGGSGSHRIDDPSTWEWSDNPMVALDHFLLGRYWDGRRTFGIGLSADEVPYSYFAAQANICDEDVDKKAGGTQKRYRANGFIFANEDYASTITKLCTAMAARPADFGGRFGVIGVESRTPVLTIDDGDLIAGVAEVYTPKRSWSDLVGEVEGRFQDPAQLYQPTPYPNVTDAAWADEDGGEPKLMTLDLEFEVDVERAQRLALLKARAERRQASLRGVYPLWTIELERGDWFTRTGDKWGIDGKTFEVIERIVNTETWTVTILSQEVDPADSAWDEETAQDGAPTPDDPTDELAAVEVPVFTVSDVTISGAASAVPALLVEFTNPTDVRVRHMHVQVFQDSDDLKVADVLLPIPDDDEQVIIQNGIADGVAYYARARFLTNGLASDWSDPETATSGGGTVGSQVFTKTATFNNMTVSGSTTVTLATIDVSGVQAGGYVSMPAGQLILADVACDLSSGTGTFWYGELVLTEQLQSGGTEYELATFDVYVEDTGGLCIFGYDGDVIPWPSAPFAQNLSGNVRYRVKIRRTSGTNSITGNGLDGQVYIQRTPG